MRKFVPFVAVALFAAAPVQAQSSCTVADAAGSTVSCTVGTTLSMTVPSIMQLTLGGTTVSLDAPANIAAFSAAGVDTTVTTGPTFSVRSNRSYRVQISADAGTFSHTAQSGAATYAKPIADLAWKVDAGSYLAITDTPADIGSGSAVNSSANKTVSYRTLYDITKDQPGAYSLGVTFTLVAP
ncbi:MAG: hypothetical protein P3A32_02620 [Gemmatimonadota bacterium]|jgi:hypothetical protein|nr:hypothetical protein [Gemmatimonadota bacterium]MDQ8146980.1 hypothetical protein [Gemmatimonadota bacterium]MDQ8148703.1 hypothetical protein [Gemmatimonadota bacterium]MDQ8156111.1 hypothetical protein [Gemmatimonadota bacterium]MDQ8176395.1 hypothetical protein [Gemmatimonadota bacterium]